MTETGINSSPKLKTAMEILVCYFILLFWNTLLDWTGGLLQTDGLWIGITTYFLTALTILLYVVKIEKKPLSSIGLKLLSIKEAALGIIIGIIMFTVQQIPLLMMGMDYKSFASQPNWVHIAAMSVYCIFCVGFTEELMMRGFILHKSMAIIKNRILVVFLNCIIFYMIHWPPVRFVFGEVFNITVNTAILCVVFFFSKKKALHR